MTWPVEQANPLTEEVWHLRLYVAGPSPKCLDAFVNLRRLCNEHLAGRHEIEIIDLLEQPELAEVDDVLALPTLVRRSPSPSRTIIGDLSNTPRVLALLGIRPRVLR